MSDISTQVANRINWARYVLASHRVHGASVVEAVVENFDGADEALDVDQLDSTIAALTGQLEAASHAMRGAELALAAELSDDDAHRTERDELFEDLRAKLVRVRSIAQGGFEGATASSYGMREIAPYQPDALVAYAENVVNLLRATPRTGTDEIGIEFDTEHIADVIEETMGELEDALESVDQEQREAHTVRAERDEVVAEWENVYRGVAQLLSGLYLLAGRRDLAERVRPTLRSSTGKDEPPADVDGDLPDPLADSEDTEDADEPEVEEPVVR